MGNKLSSIDFMLIKSVTPIDGEIKRKTQKKSFNYLISYENGKTKKISLNSKENYKFQLKYKWTSEFKPLIGLNYSKILRIEICNKIKKNEVIFYNITIVYNTGNPKNCTFSKDQKELFLKFVLELSPSGKQILSEFNKKYNIIINQ